MFGENLKALRKQRGMSQEVMAQQLNVARQTQMTMRMQRS